MRASTSIVLLSGLLSAFIGPLLAGAERYAVGPRQGSHSSPSITSASLSSSFPTNGPSQSSSTMQVAATSLTSSTTDTDGSSSMKQASSMASSPSASTAIASASVSASPSKGITTSSTPAIKSTHPYRHYIDPIEAELPRYDEFNFRSVASSTHNYTCIGYRWSIAYDFGGDLCSCWNQGQTVGPTTFHPLYCTHKPEAFKSSFRPST